MLREKKRYIAFEVLSDSSILKGEVIRAIKSHSNELRLVFFRKNKGIVKCPHIKKEDTIKFLNSINSLNGKEVKIITKLTSGTIRKVKECMRI